VSSFELELQGWRAYSWVHGLVLKKGTYAIFIQGSKVQDGDGGGGGGGGGLFSSITGGN